MAHLPLLRNNDKNKSKISKRRNPVSLDYYRETGILPAALVNFLALMGWSFGGDREIFSLEEMVARFDIAPGTIGLTGPVFDLEKLAWLNGHYLRELSDEALVDEVMAWRVNREYLLRVAPLVRERIRRLDEFVPMTDYFFAGDLDYAAAPAPLVPKSRDAAATVKVLARLGEQLDTIAPWTATALEEGLRPLADDVGWSTKELFMTLRLVITGRSASPPLFDTMAAVGRERCRRRVAVAQTFLRGQK
jgi:glutamyl-tRNA synthetase